MKRTKKTILGIIITIVITGLLLIYYTFKNELVSVSSNLNELSGFEFDKEKNLWGINDSGNLPEIYQIDSVGNIEKTIKITNAENIDWEDMTQDNKGNFYIGDFGNNLNKRKNLTIYKINNPTHIKGNETKAEIIRFKFEDQFYFPEPKSDKNFDLEAFIFYKNELYLFTKNRTKPFDGQTHLYKVNNNAGNYKAKFISSVKTCSSNKYLCWITSAAINPSKNKIALMSSNKIFLLENWKGDDFFSGSIKEIDIGLVTQKEAITFYNDSIIIYADEKFKKIGGNIYYLNINKAIERRLNRAETLKAPN